MGDFLNKKCLISLIDGKKSDLNVVDPTTKNTWKIKKQ
jgi:hypothetical protein